jgi:hypothetical protein
MASFVSFFLFLVFHLLVIANVVLSSLILSTLMMEAIGSYEMSALIRATLSHIPSHPHSHRGGNLKSLISEVERPRVPICAALS